MNHFSRKLGIHERTIGRAALGDSETIGSSVEGRPLVVHYCGNATAGLRIFILAGQHGDESDAREAASKYLARFRSGASISAHLAVLIDGNPDGAAAGRRRNASDLDLNRDHLLLCAPETQAVHSFIDRWQPDLVIDVHTYRPWRPELLQYGFVFPQDVMVDFPTNPAIRMGLQAGPEISLLNFVKFRMAQACFRCDRYTLVRPSGVRHSSLDIVDARNSLSLRYGILTVLLEGRRSSPYDPPIFTPPHLALLRSIEAVVEWGDRNPELIKQWRARPRCYDPIPVRCRYSRSKAPRYMEMQSAAAGQIHVVDIPGAYLPLVRTTRTVCVPRAYAVRRSSVTLLEILRKQCFQTTSPDQFSRASVEVYRTPRPEFVPAKEDLLAPPLYALERTRLNSDDFVLFPTDQPGGRALALFLEPESQFGAHRFSEIPPILQPGTPYPVVRVI